MSNPLVLFVDDDSDIVFALQVYFGSEDFEIDIAENGVDALNKAKLMIPHLIMLDVMLPDIDGYEVCRRLQQNPRTSHVPIIFLSQKDERSDISHGLEVGACDYVTKPFDALDLKLRMQSTIARSEANMNPYSRLPTGSLIVKQLPGFTQEKDGALLHIRINNFGLFIESYGGEAGHQVLSHTSRILIEIVENLGSASDFVGHIKDDHFIILTTADKSSAISHNLIHRFEAERQRYYSPADLRRELIRHANQIEVALMSVAVSEISSGQCQSLSPTDILEQASKSSVQQS
jgi:DNA-binding response OmpR family regulator